MLYHSGFSYKDLGQECILVLSSKEVFAERLRRVVVAPSRGLRIPKIMYESDILRVRVQWETEKTIRLEKLLYQSIQIGVLGALVQELIKYILKIENDAERARELKRELN